MIYLMGHWWQNWLYIELFCSCGFVSIFAPIDSIILKHDLLLDRSSQICKLIVSGQFSGPTWMSCLLTEKLLKNFQLRSLLWPASWKQKLLSAVAASDLFRSRPGNLFHPWQYMWTQGLFISMYDRIHYKKKKEVDLGQDSYEAGFPFLHLQTLDILKV